MDLSETFHDEKGEYKKIYRMKSLEEKSFIGPPLKIPSLKYGAFLDIETTGLSYENDKIIELAIIKFRYNDHRKGIFSVLDHFSSFNDPKIPISENISKLTGITNKMVAGHEINMLDLEQFWDNIDLVIAHNASFDRPFFETAFPSLKDKHWACSLSDIDWVSEGINTRNLEFIGYKLGFYFDGHRAINDCLAGIKILSHELPTSKTLAFKALLDNAKQFTYKIYAINSKYEYKDLLRSHGYRWDDIKKTWFIEVKENQVEEEFKFLRESIYKMQSLPITVDILSAYNKFSSKKDLVLRGDEHCNKKQWLFRLSRGEE